MQVEGTFKSKPGSHVGNYVKSYMRLEMKILQRKSDLPLIYVGNSASLYSKYGNGKTMWQIQCYESASNSTIIFIIPTIGHYPKPFENGR